MRGDFLKIKLVLLNSLYNQTTLIYHYLPTQKILLELIT